MRNNSLDGLVALLGENNVDKLKSSIADALVDRVREDIDNYGEYYLDPLDITGLMNEVLHDNEKKLRKMHKDAIFEITENYINDMKSYMKSAQDNKLRHDVYELACKHFYRGNEYSKDREFANELLEILHISQEEILKGESNEDM